MQLKDISSHQTSFQVVVQSEGLKSSFGTFNAITKRANFKVFFFRTTSNLLKLMSLTYDKYCTIYKKMCHKIWEFDFFFLLKKILRVVTEIATFFFCPVEGIPKFKKKNLRLQSTPYFLIISVSTKNYRNTTFCHGCITILTIPDNLK